jgi:hypothetical protein
VVFGVLGALAIIFVILFFLRQRRRQRRNKDAASGAGTGAAALPSGARQYDDMGDVQPSGQYGALNVNRAERETIMMDKPIVDKFKILKDEVEFGPKIGAGQFGTVYKGPKCIPIYSFVYLVTILMMCVPILI